MIKLERLAKLPKNTLDEQASYWSILEYELAMCKLRLHKPETDLFFKIMKKDYPNLFKDFQLIHQANKEIRDLIIS